MSETITINGRDIGTGHHCLVIAEAGVNHNGDMAIAHQLIDAAVQAGADAVKFQSFITEDLITPDAPKANYQVETTGTPGSQYSMLKALELSAEQQLELKQHCDDAGIIYVCTPYEYTSIDMLDQIDVPVYKVASTDTTNTPFLRYMASKNRPIILSTGMCTISEVEEAVIALGDSPFAILQCTSEYPAPMADLNLRAMETMRMAFRRPVGFSDHTPGVGASPWAVALGASIVEKHFTLDRTMTGPDHRASVEPDELKVLVQQVRDVELALGDGIKRLMSSEIDNKPRMQKSLVLRQSIRQGDVLTKDHLTTKRPGDGLPPSWQDRVLGKKVKTDLSTNSVLKLHHIDWGEE